jgi:hypothetical protein
MSKLELLGVVVCIAASLFGCAEGNGNGISTSTSSSSSSASSSGAGGSGGSGEENIPEPDGPSKLTILNGVNDYDAIRLCFVPWPDGGDSPAYPADAKGMPFAASAIMDMNSGIIPQGTDVYLWVIAGNLDKTAGKGCAEITGGTLDSEVLLTPLAVIPASAFAAPRSLLLVPHGCLGGAGHEDMLQTTVCGKTYSLDTPTPGLLAGGMSRIVEDGVLSLQAAHAVVGMPEIDIRVLPAIPEATAGDVAPALSLGAIGKMPPFREFSKAALGPIGAANILTFPPGFGNPSSTTLLKSALDRGGISEAEFKDGAAYTFVAVGSPPTISEGAFWHALTWTAVRADPE